MMNFVRNILWFIYICIEFCFFFIKGIIVNSVRLGIIYLLDVVWFCFGV